MKMITLLVFLISLATVIPPGASPPTESAEGSGFIDPEKNFNRSEENMNRIGQDQNVSIFEYDNYDPMYKDNQTGFGYEGEYDNYDPMYGSGYEGDYDNYSPIYQEGPGNNDKKCDPDEFACSSGDQCVRKYEICQGFAMCKDKSDLAWCNENDCGYQFACSSGDQCAKKGAVCSGFAQCEDKSDLFGCKEE